VSADLVSRTDFDRLEAKVDILVERLEKVILFEERQKNQMKELNDLSAEITVLKAAQVATDKKVDQWINRGMGVWALAGVMWAIFEMASSSNVFKLMGH
jgi:hypothetical protein